MTKSFWIRTNGKNEIVHVAFGSSTKRTHYDAMNNQITRASENRIKKFINTGNVKTETFFLQNNSGMEIYCDYRNEVK